MAPEQAAGDPHTDHRADLYALGVVAWEMLAGRTIFGRRPPHELLAAHIAELPIPIEELRPDLPAPLAALVRQCLEKHPADRPQSAAAVRDALAELGAGLSLGSGGQPSPGRRAAFAQRWPILAAATAAIVALGAMAWLLVPRSAPADETVVAVLPFDVSGNAALGYLREGMLDLLAAKLTGEGGPRAAEPRAVLAAWRRAAGSDTARLPRDRMLQLAERLGAGQVLTGEIAGGADRLVLSASLLRVKDGRIVSEQESGPADSLPQLLDRLVAKLLARSAGEGERLPMLAGTPLPALRAYLAGQSSYRRGHYRDAVREYARAIDADSTFTLAALGLVDATAWVGDLPQRQRGARIAWRAKDALPERERARLIAIIGERYPGPTPYSEQHAANVRYAQLAPDRAEAHFQLGDGLFHFGQVIGIRDAHAQAQIAFGQALALDSSFAPALEHLVLLAAKEGDTARAVRFAERYLAIDETSESADGVRWRLAAMRGDAATMERLSPRIAAQGGTSMSYVLGIGLFEGVGAALAQRTLDSAISQAETLPEKVGHAFAAHDLALARGRPKEAAAHLKRAGSWGLPLVGVLREQVKDALYWDGDTLAAAAAAKELERTTPETAIASGSAIDTSKLPLHLSNVCVLERWRLAHGSTATARRSIAALRAFVGRRERSDPLATLFTQCMITVDAQLAVLEKSPDAPARVARLDSVLLTGPAGSMQDVGNLVVAQLKEQTDDVEGALAAVRRREYVFTRGAYVSTYLREEGRLAELAGDVEGAIAAYRQYLALRSEPEPELAVDVEAIRERLERLIRRGSER
jgi:tetratricopeptide (TPR) repeat protein